MTHALRLFGTIELTDPAGASCEDVLNQPKRAALLAYLAAARPFGFQRRDRLLSLFWPDSDQAAARRALNQSVHFLRRHLGADGVVSRGAEEVGLADTAIACDTIDFRRALDREDWTEVLAVYRGDLLDGFFVSDAPEFEQWLEQARAAYRDDAIRAAWSASDEACARGKMDEARRWAHWAIAQHPYDESSFRRYLDLLHRSGDRAAAVQAYAQFASRLQADLEIAPSPETTALAEAIRIGTAEADPMAVAPGTKTEPDRVRLAADDTVASAHPVTVQAGPIAARPIAPSAPGSPAAWLPRLAGAGIALVLTRLAVIELGLPDWIFVGALVLVGLGLVVLGAMGAPKAGTAGRDNRDARLWRGAVLAGVVAWSALGLAAAGYLASRALGIGPASTLLTRGVLEVEDEVLLADFENHTGDSLLGHAMTEALRIDLTQSRTLRLVDPDRVVATLRLMTADPSIPLAIAVARDAAQRLGVKAIVAGDITPVGSGFFLSVSILSSGDGSTLWADRAQAATEGMLIETLGDLSRGVRAEVGESLRDLRATRPLEEVTTTSIPALTAFSEGVRVAAFEEQRNALPFFARAASLDPTFAMAHQRTARILANTGGSRTAQAAAIERAFELRDRTTEIERLLIESTYFALTGDGEQALATWRRLNTLQPEEWRWWNNVGTRVGANLLAQFPNHEESIAALVHAQELCKCAFPLGNLTSALLIADLADSAQAVIDRYSGQFPELTVWPALRAARAYHVGDLSGAAVELEANPGSGRELSAVLAVQGKLAASREAFEEWAAQGRREPAATYLAALTSREALEVVLGASPAMAIRRVEDALDGYPLDSIESLDRPYLPLAEFFVRAGQTGRAAALMDEYESTVEARWRRLNEWRRLLVRGLIAQEEDGPERALPTLERAVLAANAFLGPVPDYGFALDRAGETDSAMAVYRRFLGPSPRYAAWNLDARWRTAVLKRLGELHEARGEGDQALGYYQEFLETWSHADEELQPQLRDVRQRMAGLARERARARNGNN